MAGDGGESREFNPFRSVLMLLDLTGKKILVTGIANNRSIAWGIAQQLKAAGAELGITYLPDDKGRFEAKVRELTAPLEPSLFLPLNVQDADQMAEVFGEIKEKWGVLDGLVHCLAFAGKEERRTPVAMGLRYAQTFGDGGPFVCGDAYERMLLNAARGEQVPLHS